MLCGDSCGIVEFLLGITSLVALFHKYFIVVESNIDFSWFTLSQLFRLGALVILNPVYLDNVTFLILFQNFFS